jgi:hypothetical protein
MESRRLTELDLCGEQGMLGQKNFGGEQLLSPFAKSFSCEASDRAPWTADQETISHSQLYRLTWVSLSPFLGSQSGQVVFSHIQYLVTTLCRKQRTSSSGLFSVRVSSSEPSHMVEMSPFTEPKEIRSFGHC